MKYVYWDSCCFLSYLEGEPRGTQLLGVIQRAQAGELAIVTSVIALTEVLGSKNADEGKRDRIKAALSSSNGIYFVDLTEYLAKETRDLIWSLRFHNHKADAVHLATALFFNRSKKIEEIHTFDADLLRLNGQFEIPIIEPSLQLYPGTQQELPL